MAHVSDVEQPHISDIKNFGVLLGEEILEVFSWLDQITEPQHSRQIWSLALEELTSDLYFVSVCLVLGLLGNVSGAVKDKPRSCLCLQNLR